MRLLPLFVFIAARAALAGTAAVDTTVTTLDEVVVSGIEAPTTRPDRMRLEAPVIEVQDPASLADLGRLVPSARVSTTSRGESHLMIRGAPERHVQTFLDDIPLNLPWDERVDLATIPIVGTATLTGTRGLATLLDGPGVLAGSLRIVPAPGSAESETRLGVRLGDMSRMQADLQHRRRTGSWDLTGAGGWRERDGWPVPGSGDMREGSDLEQGAVLLHAGRAVAGRGRLNLLATAWSSEQGVPPETHLGDDARFWRYPVRKRALAGASLDLPLGKAADWDLQAAVSADYFEQEIDQRDDADPDLYEHDRDRTGYGHARLTRWLGAAAAVTVQATARYTHHTESLTLGGPRNDYAQWLASLAAETDMHLGDPWTIRLGLGWDHAATPEAGDKDANDPTGDPAAHARVTRALGQGARVYASASRRSRFPSLRELYSGAQGRFVPNPDLRPEKQDLYEIGIAAEPGAWQLEAGAFVGYLKDGIEKLALNNEAKQFQRVNRTEIRVPGVELVARWRARHDLRAVCQYTLMSARVGNEGAFDRPAEDRPDYLARLALDWRPYDGPGAMLEADVTGARWSADASGASEGSGGLARLPTGVVWNARLSWRFVHPQTTVDFHLRADNLFDQSVPYQLGLSNPGRVVSAGAAIDF